MPVVSSFLYDDVVAPALMHRFKFAGARALAPWMGATLAAAARRHGGPPPGTVLCPVPLAPHRRRERGYNQAELLARETARRLRVPMVSLLDRADRRGRQTERGKAERGAVSQSVFAPRPGSAYLPVVIVDDVYTTGSTLEACRKTLETYGHSVCYALTVFRTPRRRAGPPARAGHRRRTNLSTDRDYVP